MSTLFNFFKVVNFETSASVFYTSNIKNDVEKEFTWIQSIALTHSGIYGLNTLTGHRDDETIDFLSSKSQLDLIKSHLIPSNNDLFNPYEVRCISVAKLCAVSNGGTGLGPLLTTHLIKSIDSSTFNPKIPVNQSYSSGDVIPAAYWADYLLGWNGYINNQSLYPGEALALINGAFIHLGLAASCLPSLLQCKDLVLHAFSSIACLSGHGSYNFKRLIFAEHADASKDIETLVMLVNQYSRDANTISTSPQASVSIRSFPEVLILLNEKITKYKTEVGYSLNSRSANPMFNYKESNIASQATFMLPSLSVDGSSVIESLLFAGSSLIGGMQYILSGHVKDIPIDGKRNGDSYGFIQVPKELMARLEYIRLMNGRRPFSSGASTSYGIEDLWSHGMNISILLKKIIEDTNQISLRVINVCEILSHLFQNKKIFNDLSFDKDLIAVEILKKIENSNSEKTVSSFDSYTF